MTMKSRNVKRRVVKIKSYHLVATALKLTLIFSMLRTAICNENVKLIIKPFSTKLEDEKQFEPEIIINLNKYLLELDPSCLIHITNYQNGNLLPFATPVLLQQMKPGMVENLEQWTPGHLIMSVPAEFKLPMDVVGIEYGGIIPCPTSHFLSECMRRGVCSSICGELDFGYFLAHSKPWRCEATITLFPPKHLLTTQKEWLLRRDKDLKLKLRDLRAYSTIFRAISRTGAHYSVRGLNKVIPSHQPINILVLRDSDVKGGGKIKNLDGKLQFWMDHFLISAFRYRYYGHFQYPIRRTELTRNIFVLFLTKQLTRNLAEISDLLSVGMSSVGPKIELISSKRLVKGIAHGSYFDMLDVLNQIGFARGSQMAFCNFIYDRLHLYKASNEIGLVAAYSKVWTTIMSNMSIVLGEVACNPNTAQLTPLLHKIPNAAIVSLAAYNLGTQEYSPIQVEDSGQSLGIISCGQPAVSPITLTPLFSIFDSRIWFCIFITFFVIAPIAAYGVESQSKKMRKTISKNKKRCQAVLNHLCLSLLILLKQGAPRLMTRTKFPGLKFVAGSILLIGLVISNAYLYPYNLRRLISPRRLSRPWHYHDLIRGNYQIFTRANIEGISEGSMISNMKQTSEHSFVGLSIKSKLSSEVSTVAESNPQARGIQNILQRSSLHPHIFSKAHLGKTQIDKKQFRAIEKSILLKELLECRRVAIVLPFQKMYEYYTETRFRRFPAVSVMPETLHRKVVGIHLSGWLSDEIISRVGTMYSSGILGWLKGRFGFDKEGKLGGSRYHRYVTAASMSGNIIVVFLLLAFGLFIGAFSFFIEKMIHFMKYSDFEGKEKTPTEKVEEASEESNISEGRQVDKEKRNEFRFHKSEVSSLTRDQVASTTPSISTSPIKQELETRSTSNKTSPPIHVIRLRKDVDVDEIVAVDDV
ncbi:unnamed protein product [Orchesella dallaii]|uniref:Uncharacterized protein n=1 Tax=Orchesella dallaii TaxID=48710 RepID=A0ABP1PZU1_9HEXA